MKIACSGCDLLCVATFVFLCDCLFPPVFVCVVFQCLCVVCALLCDDVLFVS